MDDSAVTSTVSPTEAESPPGSPAASPEGETGSAAPEACSNVAAFYGDITVPDGTAFRQGEVFTKIWRIKNAGTCSWTTDYSMVFMDGDLMNATAPLPLSSNVAPGDLVDITMDLTAPNSGGIRYSNWLISDPQGKHFGVGITGNGLIYTQIVVNWIPPQGTPVFAGLDCQIERNPSYEAEILALINNLRTSLGLTALEPQPQLSKAALVHNTDMACNDYAGHPGTDGKDWFGRIQDQGYSYASALENIYNGDPAFGGNPDGAMKWWQGSPIHYQNMTDPSVTQVGISYVFYPERQPADQTYSGYYTVVFGRPQ